MTWTSLDLSNAVLEGGYGQYDGAGIVTAGGYPDFWFPDFPGLAAGKFYQFEVTFDDTGDWNGTSRLWAYEMAPGDYAGSNFDTLYNNLQGGMAVHTFTVGPGIEQYDNNQPPFTLFFESDRYSRVLAVRWQLGTAPPPASIPSSYDVPSGKKFGPGSTTLADALPAVADAVSMKPAAASLSGDSLWWTFTAEQSGTLYFDMDLSVSASNGRTEVSAYPLVYDVADGSYAGAYVAQVVAGHTYTIECVSQTSSLSFLFLRVSAYPVLVLDWTQDPDVSYVNTGGRPGPTGVNHGYSSGDLIPSEPRVMTLGGVEPVGATPRYSLDHSFAGAYPPEEPAAVQCSWSHSRREIGSAWWSLNNGASWNGTDPYDSSVEGHGTCPTVTSSVQGPAPGSFTDNPVGYHYHADSADGWLGGGYQSIYFRVFYQGAYVDLGQQQAAIDTYYDGTRKGTAGLAEKVYPNGYVIERESQVSDLVKVEVAPDEDPTADRSSSTGGADPGVEWYVDVCPAPPGLNSSKWGPARNGNYNTTGGWPAGNTTWNLGVDGPEGLASRMRMALPVYHGGAQAAWTELPPDMFDYAKQYLKDWYERREPDTGYYTSMYPIYAVAMPTKARFDVIPSELAPFDNVVSSPRDNYSFRNQQFLSVRTWFRPARYRVMAPPVSPQGTPVLAPQAPVPPPKSSSISGELRDLRRTFYRRIT